MNNESRLAMSVTLQGLLIAFIGIIGAISMIGVKTDLKELKEQVAAITQVEKEESDAD